MKLKDYKNKFPNGVTSYLETHHEVVSIITSQFEESPVAKLRQAEQGKGGLWELAEEITDEFERQHASTEWDGDWEETLWAFVDEKLEL